MILNYNNNNFIINIIQYLNTYFLNKVFINYKILESIIYNIVNYSSNIINKNPILNLNNKDNFLLDLYYRRFLYINKDYIIKSTKNLIEILIPKSNLILYNYDNYYYIKFKEIISQKSNNLVNILKFIDCDILGLFKIKGLKKENYIFIIIYCASKYIQIYIIKFKSDIYNIIINYYNIILI